VGLIHRFTFSVKDFKNLINLARKCNMEFFYMLNDGKLHYSSIDREHYTLLQVFFNCFDVKELEEFSNPRGILDVADVWKTIYKLKDGNIAYDVPMVSRSWGALYYANKMIYHKVLEESPYTPIIPRIKGETIEFKIGLRSLLNAVESITEDRFSLFTVKGEVGIGNVEDEKVTDTSPLYVKAIGDFSNFIYNKERVLNALQGLYQLCNSSAVAMVKVNERRLLILELPFKLGNIKYVTTSIYLEKARAMFNGRDVSDVKQPRTEESGREAAVNHESAQNATV
jgi:hypothetical protein